MPLAPAYEETDRTAAAENTVLRFENVSVVFDDTPALRDVSFDLKAGRTFILFGAAGSGKSVLLKTAIGLVRPSHGCVELFGNEITRMRENELFQVREKAGVLFQEGGLFDSLTVQENVAYPLLNQRSSGRRRIRPDSPDVVRRVREALRFVELEHTLEKFPSELSGGMRRRVGIARAAVTDPPLMLYDSPTAGLDPITANTIVALIIKARQTRNTTSIIVTHRAQDGHLMANYSWNGETGQIEPADPASGIHERTTFFVFRDGAIAFEGTEEELEAATDPYVAKFKTGLL